MPFSPFDRQDQAGGRVADVDRRAPAAQHGRPDGEGAERGGTGAKVGDRLRAAILSLELQPGQRLSEGDIVKRYGASRTPIREALHQLDREELVTRDGRGYVVRRFSRIEIAQAYELLEALETMAAGRAAALRDADALELADEALMATVMATQDGPPDGVGALADQIHVAIAEAAGNPLIRRQVVELRRRLRWLRLVWRIPAEVDVLALPGQRRILSAIRRGSAEIAVAESRHLVQWLSERHLRAAGTADA